MMRVDDIEETNYRCRFMRDPLWFEQGKRPIEQGDHSRAPRYGTIALYCLVVSAVLGDLALLFIFVGSAFDDSLLLRFPEGMDRLLLLTLWCASFTALGVGIACGILGLRGADRVFLGFLFVACWVIGPLGIPLVLRVPGLQRPHPDLLRAMYSLVLSTQLGALHVVALTLTVPLG